MPTEAALAQTVVFLRAGTTTLKLGDHVRLSGAARAEAAGAIEGAQLVFDAAEALVAGSGLAAIAPASPEWSAMLEGWPAMARLITALDTARPAWRATPDPQETAA